MIFNLESNSSINKLKEFIVECIEGKKIIDIEIKQKTRSLTLNRALHLYFKFISDELNNAGLTYSYTLFNQVEVELSYTEIIVKNLIWRPIQKALFDKESTTDITSKEINTIIDIITLHLSKLGLQVYFPNIQDFIHKNQNK